MVSKGPSRSGDAANVLPLHVRVAGLAGLGHASPQSVDAQ